MILVSTANPHRNCFYSSFNWEWTASFNCKRVYSTTEEVNAYTKNLSLRASDSIAGVEDNSITVVLGSGSPQQVDANYSTTFPSSGSEPFTVSATAKDRLGNTATLSKSYTPASGSTDGHGTGTSGVFRQGDGSSELNTAFCRSRLFNKYLVNGTHSNSDISSVPEN